MYPCTLLLVLAETIGRHRVDTIFYGVPVNDVVVNDYAYPGQSLRVLRIVVPVLAVACPFVGTELLGRMLCLEGLVTV
jgi:hypothetical protein